MTISGCSLALLLFVTAAFRFVASDNIFQPDYDCQSMLMDADGNNDGVIDRIEYLHLLDDHADGFFAGVDSFDSLPLSLRANFLSLACLCAFFNGSMNDADANCCGGNNAQLLAPDPFGDDQELVWYYNEICRDTLESIAAAARDALLESSDSIARHRYRSHMPSPAPNEISATTGLAQPDSNLERPSTVIASAKQSNVVKSSAATPEPVPWHKAHRHYFIPIATLTAFIVVALVFSLYVSTRHQYHFRQRDKNGFVLGSFPSVLPATSTLTDRNNWNEGGCFEARSLDEQDCGISFECSYDMSEVSSKISLRSIRVPSLWLSMPYSQPYYKPFADEPICEEVKVGNNISPMTSDQGSDRCSDIGSPVQIRPFRGGDHCTM